MLRRGWAGRGELYPCETDVRLCDELKTGQEVEVDMENDVLTVLSDGTQYNLKPLGEVRPLAPTMLYSSKSGSGTQNSCDETPRILADDAAHRPERFQHASSTERVMRVKK